MLIEVKVLITNSSGITKEVILTLSELMFYMDELRKLQEK